MGAWQNPQNWVTQEAQCALYFMPRGKGFGKTPAGEPGVGLVHEGSGTMALDIDDLDATRLFFATLGIDIDNVLSTTAQITRGAADRAKGIFRLPAAAAGVDLRKVVVKFKDHVAFELRGGHGHQDAMPPTMHPTGTKFEWVNFGGTLDSFAELPQELWDLWQDPDSMTGGDYSASTQKKADGPTAPWQPTLLDQLVLKHVGDVGEMLEEAGYTRHTDGRFSKPGSSTAGLVIYPDGRAWSFHGAEPLYFNNSPHPLAPFDVFVGLMAIERGQSKADTMAEASAFLQSEANVGAPPPPRNPTAANAQPSSDGVPERREALWIEPLPDYGDDPVNWPELPSISQFQGMPAIDPSPVNADRLLRQHSLLCNVFRFDEFTGKMYVVDPPWRTDQRVSVFHRENTATGAMVFLGQDAIYRRFSHQLMQRAILSYAETRRLDSLTNQLTLLPEWDRVPRIDRWLVDYCKAENTPANWLIGRKFLVGMAARALSPGCKMDNMVIMEGKEGRGKSTLFDVLAGRIKFAPRLEHRLCTEQHLTLRGDDTKASEKMQGAWLAELPELSSFSKADRLLLVSFISRKEDAYRTPYDIGVSSKPRRIVLVGTTNETGDYLENAEGNRRFWPVTIEHVDIDAVARDRDQLMAEALYAYRNGDAWWTTEEESIAAGLKALQKSRTSESPLDAYGQEALKLLVKGVLADGRRDEDRWVGNYPGHRLLFFSSSEIAKTVGECGFNTNPVNIGRWLSKVPGWHRGSRQVPPYGNGDQRYSYAPDEQWLDINIADWRKTPIGSKP
jgi:hypothetical protein